MTDITPRMNRLFDPTSGRCLDVALDHGAFGEVGLLSGMENLRDIVSTLVAVGPDAIQLTQGQATVLQHEHGGRSRPNLIMRADVTNAYSATTPSQPFSLMIDHPALRATQLDAVAVVVNLFDAPGRPSLREACIANILRAREDCDRYGVPLIVEPLALKDGTFGGFRETGEVEAIVPLVRQAVELGADIIKADPTDNPAHYVDVIGTATGIPVLVRGGARTDDLSLLERTRFVLDQGAAGLVYGRNIVQHLNPGAMTRALMAMVHQDASVAEAERIIAAG